MKRYLKWLWVYVAVISLMLCWASCRQPTEVDDIGCVDNNEPFLGALLYEVNGESTDAESLQVLPTDTFRIIYQFDDPDCNLGGGSIHFQLDDDDWKVEQILPDDIACSSTEADEPFGIELDITGLDLGGHTFQTLWLDNCGVRSEVKSGAFDLVEETTGDWGLIGNGGFELGTADTFWTQTNGLIIQSIDDLQRPPYRGQWAAAFTGTSSSKPRSLMQSFTIPSDTSRLELTFYYLVITEEGDGSFDDELTLSITNKSGQVFAQFPVVNSAQGSSNEYSKYSGLVTITDSSGLAGAQVWLNIEENGDGDSDVTEYQIDNVVLNAKTN